MPVCQYQLFPSQAIEGLLVCTSLARSSLLGASPLLFQEPIKQDPPRTLKTATVFTQPAPLRGPTKRKHTQHMLKDKGLSSRGILDYTLASYLHVHTRMHTIQHRCRIPDELNMHLKKAHKKKILCSDKNPTNYVAFWLPPWEAIASPHIYPFWWISHWGNPTSECFQLPSCPLLVLPVPHRVLAEKLLAEGKQQRTSCMQDPQPEVDTALKCSQQNRTAKSNLCIAPVIPTCPILWIERKKLVKSQLQINEQWPFWWLAKSIFPFPLPGWATCRHPRGQG